MSKEIDTIAKEFRQRFKDLDVKNEEVYDLVCHLRERIDAIEARDIPKEVEQDCLTCLHETVPSDQPPCVNCKAVRGGRWACWEPKTPEPNTSAPSTDAADVSKPAEEIDGFKVGDRVEHRLYGEGMVISADNPPHKPVIVYFGRQNARACSPSDLTHLPAEPEPVATSDADRRLPVKHPDFGRLWACLDEVQFTDGGRRMIVLRKDNGENCIMEEPKDVLEMVWAEKDDPRPVGCHDVDEYYQDEPEPVCPP